MEKPPPPTPLAVKTRRLTTLNDLRRLLAEVMNQLRQEEIPESKARALGYLASVMASVIKDSDLEKRVEELEKALEQNRH